MQFVKLTIPGEYWDSHIYSSRLYLFGLDSDISIVDWKKLVFSLDVNENLRFALQCALTNSEWLYGPKFRILFNDTEIRDLIQRKFQRLASTDLAISRTQLQNAIVSHIGFNHTFPFTDLDIYKNNLYTSSSDGIHFNTLPTKGRTKNSDSTRPKLLWDCPTVSISASFSNLAAATGPNGLYKVSLYEDSGAHRTVSGGDLLSSEDCVHCNWLETNIYGSSHSGRSCFADFTVESRMEPGGRNGHTQKTMLADTFPGPGDYKDSYRTKTKLTLKDKIFSDDIFKVPGYSWGSHDKIYLTHGNTIKAAKVQSRTAHRELEFHALEGLDINLRLGGVVSGAVAPFGTLIECDNGIVIIKGDGSTLTLDGEPVRYRVFNQSTHYENQLHVIYDDRIEIFSFNDDYFADQSHKVFGYTSFV